jgi:uncharacterized protein YjbJ (UPF0337 family)
LEFTIRVSYCGTLCEPYESNYSHQLNIIIMSAIADKLKGNWNQIKGKIKQEYGEVTDNDLTYVEGKEDEMLGRIQKKTGKSKEEIKKFIDRL